MGLNIARENLIVECSVSGKYDNSTIFQWVDKGGIPIISANNNSTGNVNATLDSRYLQFVPLIQLHEGQYTCRVTINGVMNSRSTSIAVNGIQIY